MYNTPPCYPLYVSKLVFEWLKKIGGVAAIQKLNEDKAAILYDFLDNSKIFKGTTVPKYRSLMNIPFVLPSEDLNNAFIKQSTAAGFINLKGHRLVGGMRASIYNAMPLQGVKKLVEFMKEFESKNG
jgi:phosphoserine aminotransferase